MHRRLRLCSHLSIWGIHFIRIIKVQTQLSTASHTTKHSRVGLTNLSSSFSTTASRSSVSYIQYLMSSAQPRQPHLAYSRTIKASREVYVGGDDDTLVWSPCAARTSAAEQSYNNKKDSLHTLERSPLRRLRVNMNFPSTRQTHPAGPITTLMDITP